MIDPKKVSEIVKKIGDEKMNYDGVTKVSLKGVEGIVTNLDIEIQDKIKNLLNELYPEIDFVGEEGDMQHLKGDHAHWVLDPIDGTTNFIHDFKHSVISLALIEKEEILYGIIYNPFSKELFEAVKGKGATLNGEKMRVSGRGLLVTSIIGGGTSPGYRHELDKTFKRLCRINKSCHDLRRLGSAALELAYVACGRLDGVVEKGLHLWDYAAGLLLISEAGGEYELKGDMLVASTPEIFEELTVLAREDE